MVVSLPFYSDSEFQANHKLKQEKLLLKMSEIITLAQNVVSLTINIILFYLGAQLLIIFRKVSLRGGKPAKSWLYISLGSICLAIGSLFFFTATLLDIIMLRAVGGLMHTLAGFLLLFGFYKQFKIWKKTLG